MQTCPHSGHSCLPTLRQAACDLTERRCPPAPPHASTRTTRSPHGTLNGTPDHEWPCWLLPCRLVLLPVCIMPLSRDAPPPRHLKLRPSHRSPVRNLFHTSAGVYAMQGTSAATAACGRRCRRVGSGRHCLVPRPPMGNTSSTTRHRRRVRCFL